MLPADVPVISVVTLQVIVAEAVDPNSTKSTKPTNTTLKDFVVVIRPAPGSSVTAVSDMLETSEKRAQGRDSFGQRGRGRDGLCQAGAVFRTSAEASRSSHLAQRCVSTGLTPSHSPCPVSARPVSALINRRVSNIGFLFIRVAEVSSTSEKVAAPLFWTGSRTPTILFNLYSDLAHQ